MSYAINRADIGFIQDDNRPCLEVGRGQVSPVDSLLPACVLDPGEFVQRLTVIGDQVLDLAVRRRDGHLLIPTVLIRSYPKTSLSSSIVHPR